MGGGVLEIWEPVSPVLVLFTGQYCCLVLNRGKSCFYSFFGFSSSLFEGCLCFPFLCFIPDHFFAARTFRTYSRVTILRLSIYLQLSLCSIWFPSIEQSSKQLNRVSSHIPVQFAVPSSHYAMNLWYVNTMACSIVHKVHCCQSCSVSPYDRRQPSHVYICTELPMSNAPHLPPQ
jgi:hypothetical protein